MRIPHVVPLAQAVRLLRDLQPLTGDGPFVFPAVRTPRRPMSDGTINAALRRIGYRKDQMVAHGFRAMARTLLAEVLLADPSSSRRNWPTRPRGRSGRPTRGRSTRAAVDHDDRRADYTDTLRQPQIESAARA